jgi:MFS transporter, ACS family, D-galactonate transporter
MPGESSRSRSFAPALTLLILAVLINYVDRGSLSLAAPLIKQEWGLSDTKLGLLLSSFFWSYTLLQVPVGWLSDRFNVSYVLAGGFLVWSVATAASSLATGFGLLLMMRLCLGVGESVMFPSMSKICAEQLPEEARGMANGLLMASIRWGVAVGTLGGGLLIVRFGWRYAFLSIGLISLLWLPAWMRWRPSRVIPHMTANAPLPGLMTIMSKRAFWAAGIGHFCSNYLLYLMLTWFPSYLVREHHLSTATMTLAAAAIWTVDSLSSVVTGWLTDRFIRSGTSANKARKIAMGAGFLWATLALSAMAFAGPDTYWYCLVAVAIGSGVSSAGTFAFGQTLAGARVAGRWIGMQNCLGNFSGVIGPALTGFLIDKTHHFGAAFAVAACVALMGAFAWVVGVRRLEQVHWDGGPRPFAPSVASAE